MKKQDLKNLVRKNLRKLSKTPYPGPGIIIGMDETGVYVVQVCWIMGLDEKSRNRLFIEKPDGVVETEPVDPGKTFDPTFPSYTAMDRDYHSHAVSNGYQTRSAVGSVKLAESMKEWFHEPDSPNFTPKITAKFSFLDESFTEMSLIKRSPFNDAFDDAFVEDSDRTYFRLAMSPGFGHCITTYSGDGNPLPSFSGDPYILPLSGDIENIAETFWGALNPENRISLAVKFINRDTREVTIKVINKYAQKK